jgi:hypothetical protein
VVEKGHGYLRLTNDAYAIGGWIEIGQSIIQRVSDGMLLTVPEGTFEVYISASGFNTTRKVTIERNKETTIDLGDVEIEEIRKGKVIFTVTPSFAAVYVDGEEVDTSKVVELEFGLHQIVCEADGYDTITQYIKVTEGLANVNIVMDVAGTNPSVSDNELPDNTITAGIGRVYIDSPAGVEVYVDGVYMGMSPVHFAKRIGSLTITLRREGYITKSYTIFIDDAASDVTYSFSALERNLNNENDNNNNGNNNGDNNGGNGPGDNEDGDSVSDNN